MVSVDRHTDAATFAAMHTPFEGRRNVHFLPRRSSPYRSFGHVRSTLGGIAHLRRAGIAFDYLSVLTGQDLPIKPIRVIAERLAAADGAGFMEHFPLPDERWSGGGLNRFSSVFVHTHRRHGSIGRRRFGGLIAREYPFAQRPYGGSGYWTLPRAQIDYIDDFVRQNPSFLRFFRTTDMPDETFFHTILMNSPHAGDIRDDDLRCIDWTDRSELPKIFRSDDFSTLATSDDLFARKFDVGVDAAIIERVVTQLVGSSS